MKKITYILTILICGSSFLMAQDSLPGKDVPITLNAYLSNVSKGNLGYIAEQFNVNIAEAEFMAAKIFPDPEISTSYSNNQDQTLHMGQGIETGISYPVSLGNKRGANIALALSQYELSQLSLDAYFMNLRADAALSYFSALKSQKIFQLKDETQKQMQRLAQTDSIRLLAGEANEMDALQSALEAKAQQNEVFQSRAEMQNALTNLIKLQGKKIQDTLFIPSDDFPLLSRNFILSQLIDYAIQNKVDIKMAIKNKEISEKNLRLLSANRAFEFNIEAGYSYNSVVKNEIAPAPSYHGYSAGISIPLKFSNLNRNALHAARYAILQSEANYKDLELKIITEVTQAYNNFLSEKQKLEYYKHGLIDNAEKILQGRIYAYQRGESGLVEVINARHTYNNLRNDYLETLFGYTLALIELERACGLWDIQ